jgi:subtilisin family serine protease
MTRPTLSALLVRAAGMAALLALTLPVWTGAPSPAGAAPAGDPGPAIDPALEAAVASGESVRAHVVLRGARPLVADPTDADEKAFKNDVAAAHRELRGALPARGVRVLSEHAYAFGAVIEIDADGLEALKRLPMVQRVYLDGEVHAALAQGVPLIGANQLHTSGYTGSGMTIAILDTGINYNHSALGGCFGPACKVVGGFDFVNNDSNPLDDNGHGTEVAGVAAADGVVRGVAYQAKLAALKVLSASGSGSFAFVDNALNWVLTNRTTFNIKVVNMSLGDGSQHPTSSEAPCNTANTASLIQSLVNAGVAVTVASGNDAFSNGISFPACVAQATAIGGVYDDTLPAVSWCGATCGTIVCSDSNIVANKFVCHTNHGGTNGGPLDLLTPDWRTTTTSINGGTGDFGGTSAASPYAAGAFALMFNVAPTASVATIETNLKSTGVPVTTVQGPAYTYPRIDVNAAARNFDADLDGRADGVDNCPTVYNPTQTDGDGDGKGNVCDNCPTIANASQSNLDGDPAGDACDCATSNAVVYPGAPEVCDGFNNNCNAPGWPSLAVETDDDGDGQAECAGDCDDTTALRRTGLAEACDGIDNNCDLVVPSNEADADSDGFRICAGDCNDGNAGQHPGLPEICDGLDNDCAGGVPVTELDTDADGYRPCTGDCDDAHATVHPGGTEICDGLDNDCAGGPLANEANADGDGFMLCQGDCDDAHASVYPGAPEVCDGRNNNCSAPGWPSLAVESDDDTDGLAECAGDCNDADARIRPGYSDVCDGLDNDCNGSIDPTYPFITDVPQIAAASDPNGAASDQFGARVLRIDDVDADGVADLAISSTGWPSGAGARGEVTLVSGATRAVIRQMIDPLVDNAANLGSSLASPGDVNGDGKPDVAAGAPFMRVGTGVQDQGRVVMLSGVDGALLWGYQQGSLPVNANLGTSLASIGDLNGDGVGEVLAGATLDCSGGLDCAGSVAVLSGGSGTLIRLLLDPVGESGEKFGSSVAGLGDVNGDGLPDIAVGIPFKATQGFTGAGAAQIFSGLTGAWLRTLEHPTADVDDNCGATVASIPDLNGDGKTDVAMACPGRVVGSHAGAGEIVVFSGATGSVLRIFSDPQPADGDRLGSSISTMASFDSDSVREFLVGSPLRDTPAGADSGQVLMFRGSDGGFITRLAPTPASAGDRFGDSFAVMPPLDGDAREEVAAGAPLRAGAGGGAQGAAPIVSPKPVSDCDGDGVRNTQDTCTDADQDGYGSTAFGPPAGCAADCDDDHMAVRPGGVQVCDGLNNNCNDPSWPSLPVAECFAILGFHIDTILPSQTKLDWNVPAGGADLYRIYKGTRAAFMAGHNGGDCFTTTTANTLTFTETMAPDDLVLYLIAGVRGGVEGSRGKTGLGQERETSNVCP